MANRSFAAIAAIAALLAAAAYLGPFQHQGDKAITPHSPIAPDVHPATSPSVREHEFPAAELRSALNDACSDATLERDGKAWTDGQIQSKLDAINGLKQSLSDRLSISPSADHLHVAALVEKDPALRIELIDRAISHNPSDSFLVWSAVQICYESGDSVDCRSRGWDQRLVAIDGQNSESWLRVAANRYKAGETDSALEAMRRAATAAETRIYWTERIEMLVRGLAAAGSDFSFPERAGMALGLAAMALPRYGDFTTMCEEQSAQNVDWAYACLRYGELAENQGKTEIGVAIALAIQKLALEALGELDKATEVGQRIEARRQQRMDLTKTDNLATTERLIISNPTLFFAFLAAIRSEGEVNAKRRITAEIERLIEQQPELACGTF